MALKRLLQRPRSLTRRISIGFPKIIFDPITNTRAPSPPAAIATAAPVSATIDSDHMATTEDHPEDPEIRSISRTNTQNSVMRTFDSLVKENAAATRLRRLNNQSDPSSPTGDAASQQKKKHRRWSTFSANEQQKKLRRWSTLSVKGSGCEEEQKMHVVEALPAPASGPSGRVAGYRDPYGRRMSSVSSGAAVGADKERRHRSLIRRILDHKWAPDFLH